MEIEELQKENERIKKLISVKTDMVSITAHQARTSLSGLKWIIKMFLDGDLGKLNDEQESLMRKAYEGNERAINNLNELLLTNKTENAIEKDYMLEKVDLLEIIEESIFDFSGEAHAKDVEVIFLKGEHAIPFIKSDKEKIRVVLQNLIENAIKYSDNKGKVFITIKEKDGMLQISIKNTGTYISEEGKNRIFEKFYRDEEAQKREITGSGIGLYTVKDIIEKTNGKIWFESNEKEGTTFFFTLPVFEA